MEKKNNLVVIEEMLASKVVAENEAWKSYLVAQREAILKARENKKNKKAAEYAPIMDAVLEVLKGADEPMRVGAIRKSHDSLIGLSDSKVTVAVGYLVEEGKVEKLTSKKGYEYSLVTE